MEHRREVPETGPLVCCQANPAYSTTVTVVSPVSVNLSRTYW